MRNHEVLFKAKLMAQLREGFEAVQIGHGPVTTKRETPKCEFPSTRTQLQAPKFESAKKLRKIRNAWGNMSYADLITQAILSAPEKRLTLSEIYDWIVQNVPYFSDKADMPSASGWKVSAVLWLKSAGVIFSRPLSSELNQTQPITSRPVCTDSK